MSSCCQARGTGPTPPDVNVTMENVGGGAEWYVDASGPNPFQIRTATSTGGTVTITEVGDTLNFEAAPGVVLANEGGSAEAYDTATSTPTTKNIRTFYSSDSTVTVTQEALRINLKSPLAVANEGGSAEAYDTATSTATTKNFRTFYSSDSTVTVTQEATRINLKVATPAVSQKEYYEESNVTGTTNNTAYVTLWTSAAITGVANGETWEVDANVLICQPSGLTTVNNMTDFQIETSAGVFTSLETNVSSCIPITIGVGQRSIPHSRIFQFVASMATPRFRIRMAMTAAVATGAQWEYPRIVAHKKLA